MTYTTAKAFRQALNDRLSVIAKRDGLDLSRLQRRVAFERFLARVFQHAEHDFILKGGYALELRLGGKARATIDLDFAAPRNRQSQNDSLELPYKSLLST
jgi:predicted nucleotidyltransferase component of viral defense system